jgi:hypothetical protein
MSILNSKIPEGPISQKWSNHKAKIKVVSPANKRKLRDRNRISRCISCSFPL